MSERLVLVTNDDGVEAEGLRLLERVAARHARVITVAPRTERSACGHSITLHAPLRILERGEGRYAVDGGTPADCVYLAFAHILDRLPDAVFSGVNHGYNLGFDVVYSGTVAGAREAAIKGVAAAAISFGHWPGDEAAVLEPIVDAVVGAVLDGALPPGGLLNINVPDLAQGLPTRVERTRLGRRVFSTDVVCRRDPRGGEYVWIGGSRIEYDESPGTDCHAVRHGAVSITPLKLDTTDEAALDLGPARQVAARVGDALARLGAGRGQLARLGEGKP